MHKQRTGKKKKLAKACRTCIDNDGCTDQKIWSDQNISIPKWELSATIKHYNRFQVA